jgi:hypothetical protein
MTVAHWGWDDQLEPLARLHLWRDLPKPAKRSPRIEPAAVVHHCPGGVPEIEPLRHMTTVAQSVHLPVIVR